MSILVKQSILWYHIQFNPVQFSSITLFSFLKGQFCVTEIREQKDEIPNKEIR